MDYVLSLKYQWQPYIQCLYRSLPTTIQHQTIKVIPIANMNTPVAISLKIKITTFILYFFKNGYKKWRLVEVSIPMLFQAQSDFKSVP